MGQTGPKSKNEKCFGYHKDDFYNISKVSRPVYYPIKALTIFFNGPPKTNLLIEAPLQSLKNFGHITYHHQECQSDGFASSHLDSSVE